MVVATGTFGDTMAFEAQRNFWKDEGAAALLDGWVGEYAWTAPDGGKLTLALNAQGTVKALPIPEDSPVNSTTCWSGHTGCGPV